MLAGAATDELYLIEEIENLGGMVVADTLCFGSRAFWDLPDTNGGPLRQLAEGYLRNLNCPRMFKNYEQRRDFVLEPRRGPEVDGAILIHNKFCDLHAVDNVALRWIWKKRDSGAPPGEGLRGQGRHRENKDPGPGLPGEDWGVRR